MQTQDNTEMCYRKGNQRTQRKPLCGPPSQIDSLVNKVGVQGYKKDPPSSSYQQASSSYVFTSYLDPTISSKLHLSIYGFF